MSKGRKFDAAEKHFLKKEITYKKEQKQLYENISIAQETIRQLKKEIVELKENLTKALAERDEALKLLSMNPEEIQEHLKQTKAAAEVCGVLSAVRRFSTK